MATHYLHKTVPCRGDCSKTEANCSFAHSIHAWNPKHPSQMCSNGTNCWYKETTCCRIHDGSLADKIRYARFHNMKFHIPYEPKVYQFNKPYEPIVPAPQEAPAPQEEPVPEPQEDPLHQLQLEKAKLAKAPRIGSGPGTVPRWKPCTASCTTGSCVLRTCKGSTASSGTRPGCTSTATTRRTRRHTALGS